MPFQIYPGVFSPNFNQAPSFQATRAKQYLTSYTEARYENWGLALKQAEISYKADHDAYTARAKALKDLEEAAHKDLASAERVLLSLQKEDRTTEDKQKTIEASRKTEHDKWKASEIGKDRRTSVMARAPKGTDETNTSTIAADAAAVVNTPSDYAKAADRYVTNTNDPTVLARSGISTSAQVGYTAKQTIEGIARASGATVDDVRRDLLASGDPNSKQLVNDYNLATPTTTGGSVSTGKGNYDPTIPRLADRADAIKEAEADLAEKKKTYAEALLARTGLSAPTPSLIENARELYANQFETLPGYLQHKKDLEQVATARSRADATRSLIDMFITDRKAKLGPNATAEDMLSAKTEGAKDALFFLKYKELRGKAENKREPILEESKVVGFKPAGFAIEAPPQGEQESLWDYIDGPKKGLPLPDGLRARLGALQGERTQEVPVSTGTISSPISRAPEEDYVDLGEEVIAPSRILPRSKEEMTTSLALAKDRSAALKGLLGGLDEAIPESEVDAFQFGEGGGVLPPAPATVKIEKRPDKELVMEEIKKKGPKLQEGRAIAAQIKDSHELSLQPKKIDRLTKTTSYGPYVKDLFAANKASKTPRNGAELREDVIKNLPEGQREEATRLLFALMLSN